jgi:TonB family protein
MRVFKALIISLLVYALFIWLYLTYFSKIVTAPVQPNKHVIKIDIRDIPLPVKPKAPPVSTVPKKKEIAKAKAVVKEKPIVKKKIVKKKPVKKKIVKKKVVKKKIPKKKIVVKKKAIKKKIVVREPIVIPEPIIEEKNQELQDFESQMVYIPEPMLAPQNVQPTPVSPWSYPNNKIRKLYGAGFHQFTPTQKKFIENNLNTIQEITQRTLTQRGYPEGAGRTGQEGTNVVSFNLHPNGNISDLRLKTRIGYRALDDNTLSLIRVAYMDYPYPSTTTKIIFYVKYSIYGY